MIVLPIGGTVSLEAGLSHQRIYHHIHNSLGRRKVALLRLLLLEMNNRFITEKKAQKLLPTSLDGTLLY